GGVVEGPGVDRRGALHRQAGAGWGATAFEQTARHLRGPPPEVFGGANLDATGRELAVVADRGRAVRIARAPLDRIGVPGGDDDRTPVVHGVVEREERALLPSMKRARADEPRHRLVGESSFPPERARGIDELL